MILEEVMNYNYNTINISEATVSLEDYIDLVCEQCNDILEESAIEDFKITKEDLIDPKKLDNILKRLERERLQPTVKEKLITNIVIVLLGFAYFGGTFYSVLHITKINSLLLYAIGALITVVLSSIALLGIIHAFTSFGNFSRILFKVREAKKKLAKEIANEPDKSKRKALSDQVDTLLKVEEKVNDYYVRVLETSETMLHKNIENRELDMVISDKSDKKKYISRLEKYIKDEKDPKIKKRMEKHLERVKKYVTIEELEE